jgi:cobalamin biosynthesis protein CobD/CbiB
VLNYIPERIAVGLILATSKFQWRALANELHEKKNIPLTIAAMSYALGVKLEKKGHYSVGERFERASEKHIERAIKVMKRSSILFAVICIVVMFVFYFVSFSRFTSFTAASTALFA